MKFDDLHPSALAFCPSCRTAEMPRFVYNTLIVNPVHSACGCDYEFLTPAQMHERKLREEAKAQAEAIAKARPQESGGSRRALSKREVARELGKRRSFVAAQVDAGNIKSVWIDKHQRISRAEVDRVLREGLPELPGQQASAGQRKMRPRRAGPRRQLLHDGGSGEIPGELRSFRSPPTKG